MIDTLAEQLTFRPPLPIVYGCQDYREQRELFIRIDEILGAVGADWRFVRLSLEQYDLWQQQHGDAPRDGPPEGWRPPCCPYSGEGKVKDSWMRHTRCALRVNIVRYLTGSSLRGMSVQLADSGLEFMERVSLWKGSVPL